MMNSSDDPCYRFEEKNGRYTVLDGTDRVVMECGDEASATHYTVLLNEAYRRGYKAGYRAGRGQLNN